MKLSIELISSPPAPSAPINHTTTLLDKVDQYIQDCEASSHQSTMPQWQYLCRLYKKLISKQGNLNELERCVMDMICPIIELSGSFDGEFSSQLDGAEMIKSK